MRELTGKKSKNTPKVINVNDELCNDPQIISNEFNKYFSQVAENILKSQCNIKSLENYNPSEHFIRFLVNKFPQDVKFNIPFATEEQILKGLNSLDASKATGIDDLSAKYIHLSAPVLASHLYTVISTSIRTCVFPNLWKHAKVFLFLNLVVIKK